MILNRSIASRRTGCWLANANGRIVRRCRPWTLYRGVHHMVIRCGGSVLICLLLPTASSANMEAQAPAIPVVVENVRVSRSVADTEVGDTYVTLRNTGSRTITAWGIVAEVRFSDGRVERRTHTTDRFELADGRFLRPGGTVTTRMNTLRPNAASPTLGDVVTTVTAVIFEDGSSIGDERLVDWLFHRRELHRRVWELLEASLQDETGTLDRAASFRNVEAAFESKLDSELRNTSAYNLIRHRIGPAFEAGTTAAANQVLMNLRQLAAVRRATAAAHSRH